MALPSPDEVLKKSKTNGLPSPSEVLGGHKSGGLPTPDDVLRPQQQLPHTGAADHSSQKFVDNLYAGTNALANPKKKDEPVPNKSPKVKTPTNNSLSTVLRTRETLRKANESTKGKKYPLPTKDKVSRIIKGIGQGLADFPNAFTDTASFGLTDAFARKVGVETKAEQEARNSRVGGKIGTYAGYVGPGGAADVTANLLVRPLIKNAPNAIKGLVRLGTGGALFQTADEARQALSGENKQTLGERAKDVGIAGGIGGLTGVAGPLIRSGLNKGRDIVGRTLAQTAGALDATVRADLPQTVRRTLTPDGMPAPIVTTGERPVVNPTLAGAGAAKQQITARSNAVTIPHPDELKFAQTVKASENTNPALTQRLNSEPMTGMRTTDELNRTNANTLIETHGVEGAANQIIAKQSPLTPHEVTAAQILAKQYSSLGGEANLNKALDLVGKTAKEGREMGQAIQALSQWNKLDAEGALLQASRSVGRTLTASEGKPIVAAADKIQKVAATKSLADEVMNIVTNKKPGEALSDAEKATIQKFQSQVKQVNDGIKPFLPKQNKAAATIREVSQIAPKQRSRDQVVSFLDAKAEQARQRLAQSRNLGFAAKNQGNAVVDYAIIGASHIAKGVVNLSDFTEQMVRDFGQSITPHIHDVYVRATNIFRKENGLPTVEALDKVVSNAVKKGSFSEAEASHFKAWASAIGHMSEEFKVEATQDLQKAMTEIGKSSLGHQLAAVQTSMQLLSIPTAARNIIGNEAFNVLEKTNKITAVPIDWALSKLTGERNIVFKTNNQERYFKNFINGGRGGWKGVSPNGQFSAYDIYPEAFKSDVNPFKYLQKATGAMLQSFDHPAYMRAYGDTVGTYATLLGKQRGLNGKALQEAMPQLIKGLDQSIHDLADEAGRFATFQDDTFLSKVSTGAKRLLNKPTDLMADALVNKGMLPERLSWKGFGMGDIVLKYAKTPANIIMRGIDYSPLGLLRGIGELMPLLTKKEFNQRQAVLSLSRAITGTLGLSGLGYALASAGVLTGGSSNDRDIQNLDRLSGKGEYKVNWSALQRYVMGGLDKNAAKWQQGDRIFDWGWLQPMAISVAMGVDAQQSVEKQQKQSGSVNGLSAIRDGLLGSMNTILQQPLLQGVQNLVQGGMSLSKYGSWTGITNIFKGVPASFTPALSGQVRNFSDNTARNTYDPSALKMALNMVINKIPGLEKKLPIAYDTLGNQKEQVQGGQARTLKQGLQVFVNPVKPTNFTVTPEAKMIMDLINATGNEQIAPRTPNNYLMVNKKKIKLTPEQYSEIQIKTGIETQKQLARITPRLTNPNIPDDKKVALVISTLTAVGTKVRNQLNREYPELKPKKHG